MDLTAALLYNVFEKFLQMKESGNMISMKLRNYFKRFEVPRKLSDKNKKDFIRKLRIHIFLEILILAIQV